MAFVELIDDAKIRYDRTSSKSILNKKKSKGLQEFKGNSRLNLQKKNIK